MQITQYEKYNPVDYDHGLHRYSFRDQTYISATQLLEQFIPAFDVEERSLYMAHRYGNTPEYWKDKWRSGNRDSLTRGDFIHDREEQSLYQQKFIDYNPTPLPVHNLSSLSRLYHEPLINLSDGVYPEMKLWRHDHRIAGRSDKVILRSLTECEYDRLVTARDIPWPTIDFRQYKIADVEDYKTNKKIAKFGFQGKDKTDKLLFPLEHIEDATYWHYALQLSVYQYMLEYHGFLPGKRTLIHFPHPTDEFPEPKPVRYDLPYLRNEVIAMIKYKKNEH